MNIDKIYALCMVIKDLSNVPQAEEAVTLATAELLKAMSPVTGCATAQTEEVKVDAQSEPVADKPKQTRAKKAAKVQPEAAKAEPAKSLFEATDEAPEVEAEATPTVAELQAICLAMVRADRSKKDPIKAVIKSFGGKTIEEVDASKYVELKAALEDL